MKNTRMTFFLRRGGLLLALLLTGCHDQHNYQYYMTHPQALAKAVMHCVALPNSANEPMCLIVSQAQNDFEQYVSEEQLHPQAFGKKIMEAEDQMVKLQQDYLTMRASNHFDQVKLNLMKHAYHEQSQKVKILWTTVAVTSWGTL